MKPRITVIVVALIILPTAVMTLLTARALLDWEEVLNRATENAAGRAVETAADRLHSELSRELRTVRDAMASALERGGSYAPIEEAAARIEGSGSLAARAYLFMNPEGFVYPPGGPQASSNSQPAQIAAALRRAISRQGSGAAARFACSDESFLFAAIPEHGPVFAGYMVNRDRFRDRLAAILSEVSSGGVFVFAEGPGLRLGPRRPDLPAAVEISDSFDTRGQPASAAAGGTGPQVLAVGRLYPPFDSVQLKAVVADPESLRRAGRMRARLFGWGVVLCAFAMIGGLVLAWRETAEDIRRARARADVVAGVSHDLRTPLAAMRALADALLMGHVADPARQKQFLQTIVRECERLEQLIERVLYLIRFGQDSLAFAMRPVNPATIIESAVRSYASSVGAASGPDAGGVEPVVMECPANLPAVMCDERAIGQVIFNLVDNAWKYTPRDRNGAGPAVKVFADVVERRVHAGFLRRAGRWVRIRVEDRGIGMTSVQKRRIFRRFYRAEEARAMNVSGLGLGLAFCRQVVRQHGGRMEVRSRKGMGSVFTVLLPVLEMESGA